MVTRQPPRTRTERDADERPCGLESVLLILLGIFLRSMGRSQTNFTFEDTLTQIGPDNPFLFALRLVSARWQWIALCGIWRAIGRRSRCGQRPE
jgi:hypothetical protein